MNSNKMKKSGKGDDQLFWVLGIVVVLILVVVLVIVLMPDASQRIQNILGIEQDPKLALVQYSDCADAIDKGLDMGGKTCVDVVDCGTLSNVNTYYLLNNDVLDPNAVCFSFGSQNIVLDLNEYTISFTQSGGVSRAINMPGSATGSKVKNGNIIELDEMGPPTEAQEGGGEAIYVWCDDCSIEGINISLKSFWAQAISMGGDGITINVINNELSRFPSTPFNTQQIKGILHTEGFYNSVLNVHNNIFRGSAIQINANQGGVEKYITNNVFYPEKMSRNPYAMRIGGGPGEIYNNTIVTQNARGILFVGGTGFHVHNNFINTSEVHIDGIDDYGVSFGFRMRSLSDNNNIIENNIIINSNQPGLTATGFTFGPTGTGNIIRNNTIIHTIDSSGTAGYDSSAFNIQEWSFAGNIIANNTFKSNRIGIAIGGGNGNSPSDGLFVSNIVENISQTSDFTFYSIDFNRHGGGGSQSLLNHTFVNTSFINNLGYDAVRYIDGSGPKEMIVKWFLDVEVLEDSSPVADGLATVTIVDDDTDPVYFGSTNNGFIPRQALEEFTQVAVDNIPQPRTYESPYNVTVTYNGETQSRLVTLNESKTETFVFSSGAETPVEISEEWSHVSETSAFIYWQTNDSVYSYVEYGLTTSYGQQTPIQQDSWLTDMEISSQYGYYSHAHYLTNLQHNTEYHYRLVIIDKDSQIIYGSDQTFTTQDYTGNRIEVPGALSGPLYLLDQDNTVYVLTQDITVPQRAFEIRGNNITLDLDGHTVIYNNEFDNDPNLLDLGDFPYFRDNAAMGVYIDSGGVGSNNKVFNGIIKQGPGNTNSTWEGIGFNPIYVYSGDNNEIAGVTLEWWAAQAGGLFYHWGGNNVHLHHNVVNDNGTLILHRHKMVRGIKSPAGGSDIQIDHNLLKRVRQTAISFDTSEGGSGKIYNNEIYLDSWSTNSYGIWHGGGSNGYQTYDNKIFGTGYHLIGIGTTGGTMNGEIYDNNIEFFASNKTYGRWSEYGFNTSINGLRMTWGAENINYHDNVVVLNVMTDGITEGKHRGTWLWADNKTINITFVNNSITMIGDGDTGACTVEANGDINQLDPPPFYYINNIFSSNTRIVCLGGSYGVGRNHIFINNTLRKIGDESYYETIRIGYGVYDVYGHVFRDTILENGATLESVSWECSGSCDYAVEWTLHVGVEDGSGAPLSGASVSIKNISDVEVFSGTTGATGTLSSVLRQYLRDNSGFNNQTPHNVTVTYNGETQSRLVTLNESKTETFVFSGAAPPCYDTNFDSIINIIDLALVIYNQGHSSIDADWQDYEHLDLDEDGSVDYDDVQLVLGDFGSSC